ncbi:hypothetical protein AWZ03_015444, partial [Drosophila navojoa]
AGEPEELWTRRSNRHEDVGPKPTTQRPLKSDAGENRRRDSARVALRYVPGAVENRSRLAQPVYRSERTASGGPPRPACWVAERRRSIGPYWGHPTEATSELRRVTDEMAKARRFPSERIQPHRKELDDVLEGWPSDETSRSSTEDDEERTALLSIPQNWTVRRESTDLAEEVLELVKREAGACSRRHCRTRFKVTSEDGVYNVTVA